MAKLVYYFTFSWKWESKEVADRFFLPEEAQHVTAVAA